MIDWGSFVVVAVVSIGSAAVLVSLFSFGLRLLAGENRRWGARIGAYACFALAALGVLYGIYLIVPALHK
ncbi:hypothetical protein [Glaciihabitans sp. dw_435]|uniref:hypothetical protein n=1 Tax=Glaciihabitans sp. dw_435 TaxID=2720081 RepID=UPI001BD4CF29|nr:hypothetical protein [Glaciihabitans sp. dw_435]